MKQLCSTAGSHVHRLSAWSPHISHLHLLPSLAELDLRLVQGPSHRKCSPLLPWVDLAPLSSLQQLRQLTVHSSSFQPLPFGHLECLTQLRSLSLVNVVPGILLPPKLTQLSLRAAHHAPAWLPDAAGDAVLCFEGKLTAVGLHMPLFANSPAKLRHIPSITDAAEVQLYFVIFTDTVSAWCPHHFSQLKVLHLNILMACLPFRPNWDLSTCKLQQFCLTLHSASCMPDLRGLVHVFADTVRLHFQGIASSHERCIFNCITWRVQQAFIRASGCPVACIPTCIADVVGSLMLSQGGPPHMMVNGTSFAEAAAQAAAAVGSGPSWYLHHSSPDSSPMDTASDSDDGYHTVEWPS